MEKAKKRYKKLLLLWSVLIFMCLLLGHFIYTTFSVQVYESIEETMSNNIKFAESTYCTFLNQMKMGLLQASVEPSIKELIKTKDIGTLQSIVKGWMQATNYVDEWYIIDKDGCIIATITGAETARLDVGDVLKRVFDIKEPIQGTQLVRGPGPHGSGQGVPSLVQYVAVPVMDTDNNMIGGIVAAMSLTNDINISEKIASDTGMYTVLAAGNQIIASNFTLASYGYDTGEYLSSKIYQNTVEIGKNYIGKLSENKAKRHNGHLYYSAFRPIRDLEGKIIGSQGVIYHDDRAEAHLNQIRDFTAIVVTLFIVAFTVVVGAYYRIEKILTSEKEFSKNLALLKKFGDMVRQSADEDEVYEILFNLLKKNYQISQVVVVRKEYEGQVLTRYKTLRSEANIAPVYEKTPEETCWAIRSAKDFIVNDTDEEYNCQGYSGGRGSYVCIPIILSGKVSGIIQLQSDLKNYFDNRILTEVKMYIDTITPVIDNLRLVESLNIMASTDTLTKIYNRRYLDSYLEKQVNQSKADNEYLSVIMMDIDHFKKFNDDYDHEAGDYVLIQFAQTVKQYIRGADIVARYGGEEFVVVLPKADLDVAYTIAERLRMAVQGICLKTINEIKPPKITCSLGIACYPIHGSSADKLLQSADKALYEAKNLGRNRTCLYSNITEKADA